MANVICRVCGEPWDSNGLHPTHADMDPLSYCAMVNGYCCPCCNGDNQGQEYHTLAWAKSIERVSEGEIDAEDFTVSAVSTERDYDRHKDLLRQSFKDTIAEIVRTDDFKITVDEIDRTLVVSALFTISQDTLQNQELLKLEKLDYETLLTEEMVASAIEKQIETSENVYLEQSRDLVILSVGLLEVYNWHDGQFGPKVGTTNHNRLVGFRKSLEALDALCSIDREIEISYLDPKPLQEEVLENMPWLLVNGRVFQFSDCDVDMDGLGVPHVVSELQEQVGTDLYAFLESVPKKIKEAENACQEVLAETYVSAGWEMYKSLHQSDFFLIINTHVPKIGWLYDGTRKLCVITDHKKPPTIDLYHTTSSEKDRLREEWGWVSHKVETGTEWAEVLEMVAEAKEGPEAEEEMNAKLVNPSL